MEEDDEDIYAPEEDMKIEEETKDAIPAGKDESMDEDDDEEEEEEDEESDSDIEIVTERKEGDRPEPVGKPGRGEPSKAAPIKAEPVSSANRTAQTPAIKTEAARKSTEPPQKPGSSYPAIRRSSIDVDAQPIHEPSGKAINEVDIDADLGEDDKPWRRPGADQSDYFNYGFDEFTWASYCLKQQNLRKEAKEQKKQIEEMKNFFGGTVPGAPAVPPMAAMGGLGDFPPEMQQMAQEMMAQGMDPSQLDFNTFTQMMGQRAGAMGGQGYGQQQSQAHQQQQQQQMGGFGYGGNQGHGNQGGRGHGGRGNRNRW